MANKNGTNYFTDNGDSGVQTSQTDGDGNAVLTRAATGNIPSAKAGYAIGCILTNITTGSLMVNTGTATSCTFKSVSVVFGT